MKKFKKVLSYGVAVMIGIALTLAVVLPLKFDEETKNNRVATKLATVLADETGASSASKDKKGGAIFLEENTTYEMKGGTISGSRNTYGGAVFVSKGATFTLDGGTITGCSAAYGGAIYIASGGTCIINGGTITNNTAMIAPAIYVESGGKLSIIGDVTGSSEIADNTVGEWVPYFAGEDTTLGSVNSGVTLKTVLFGTYPKTYVGSTMNATLENWFSTNNPSRNKTVYMVGDNTWFAYTYIDGYVYVRVQAIAANSDSVYKDGTLAVTGEYTWFKVEPITWYVLNYDKWKAGEEGLELYSELVIAANMGFNYVSDNHWANSEIRSWLNGKCFYRIAFDSIEQIYIRRSTIGNNVTNDYSNADSDTKGTATNDYIYLKSYYEMTQAPFTDDNSRIAANSDFAIGNNAYSSVEKPEYATAYRENRSGAYYLRSATINSFRVCCVSEPGSFGVNAPLEDENVGIRPALRLGF